MSPQVTFVPATTQPQSFVPKVTNLNGQSLTAVQKKALREVKNEAKNAGLNICGTSHILIELAQSLPDNQLDSFNFEFEATPTRPILERRNTQSTVSRVGDVIEFHIEQAAEKCKLRRSNATAGNRRRKQRLTKAPQAAQTAKSAQTAKLAQIATTGTRYYASFTRRQK